MTYQSIILADHPLIYLRLGEASGTVMNDSSGNGNNGVYVGSPTLGVTGALVGNTNTAVGFDGATQVGTLGATLQDHIPGYTSGVQQFSFECWYKDTNVTDLNGTVFGWGDSTVLSQDEDTFDFQLNDTFSTSVGNDLPTDDGAWHHFVGTYFYDGIAPAAKCYIDGVLVDTEVPGPMVATIGKQFGVGGNCESGGNTPFYKGDLDEVAYYDFALTQSQVTTHYNAGQGTFPPPASGGSSSSRNWFARGSE
jgi:hypothetical protein